MKGEEESVYRGRLLELARDTRYRGPLEHADRRGRAFNPLCGDELVAELSLDAGGRVAELRCTVRGCAVAEASARLLAELAPGADRDTLGRFRVELEAALAGADLPARLELLRPLLVFRSRRSRHGCVLLCWQALADAFHSGENSPGE